MNTQIPAVDRLMERHQIAETPRTRRDPDRSGLRAGGRGPASHGQMVPYGVPSMISVQASTSPLSEPSSL